jgi:hypothetical protein
MSDQYTDSTRPFSMGLISRVLWFAIHCPRLCTFLLALLFASLNFYKACIKQKLNGE